MKPVPLQEWDTSLKHVINDMSGRPLNIHSLMANHPALLNAWWDLRNYSVNGGDLDQRHCELVILRVAVHMGSWYEWASHVVRGLDSGLALDEIERVRSGNRDWGDADAVLLKAVDELAQDNMISTGIRERLAVHFTERQVMDIILLRGMYLTLSCMIRTWGLELDPHVAERLPESVTENSF
jgi:4-carboxymuconolactone decarboxylase